MTIIALCVAWFVVAMSFLIAHADRRVTRK